MIWPEKLPSVLWTYQMMARTPIGKTTFLTIWSEVVIPTEVGLTSYRVAHHDE